MTGHVRTASVRWLHWPGMDHLLFCSLASIRLASWGYSQCGCSGLPFRRVPCLEFNVLLSLSWNLNNFIFEFVSCKWSQMGEWSLCWRLGALAYMQSGFPTSLGQVFSCSFHDTPWCSGLPGFPISAPTLWLPPHSTWGHPSPWGGPWALGKMGLTYPYPGKVPHFHLHWALQIT